MIRLFEIRKRDRERFTFFFLLHVLVYGGLTVGVSAAEAIFLEHFGVQLLPLTYIFASLATVIVLVVYSLFVDRLRNDFYYVVLLGIFAACVALLYAGVVHRMSAAYVALFCFFFVSNAVLLNHFWTYVADYFDAMESKRLLPYIAIGASTGGCAGGLLTTAVVPLIGTPNLLLLWAGAMIAAAALVRIRGYRLKGWVPLQEEERDESSWSNIRQSFIIIRRSALVRWMVVSASTLIICIYLAQFLASDIFRRSFPTSDELSRFFGIFASVSNFAEIVLSAVVTPWMLRTLGVGTANLVYPLCDVLTFLGLAFWYRLPMGIVGRANKDSFEPNLSGPVRNLLYNALPERFRGRIRALIEGMVTYASIVVAGGGLMLLQRVVKPENYPSLAWFGVGASVLYFLVNLAVRREYHESMVAGLKGGSIDLDDVSLQVDELDTFDLLAILDELKEDDRENAVPLAEKIMRLMAGKHHGGPVLECLEHRSPRLRKAALLVLAETADARYGPPVVRRLEDDDLDVRCAALDASAALGESARVEPFLEDPDLRVRLAAAGALCRAHGAEHDRGRRILERAMEDPDPAVRLAGAGAAGRTGDAALAPLFLRLLRDSSGPVRRTAVDALSLFSRGPGRRLPPEASAEMIALLEDPEGEVRAGALQFMGAAYGTPFFPGAADGLPLPRITACLDDPAPEVRAAAEELLVRRGAAVAGAVGEKLRTGERIAREGCIRVLAALEDKGAQQILREHFQKSLTTASMAVLALRDLGKDGEADVNPLALALRDTVQGTADLAFFILSQARGDNCVVHVRRSLRSENRGLRSKALEALSNLWERDLMNQLTVLLEELPVEEKAELIQKKADLAREDYRDPVDWAMRHPDPLVRMTARCHVWRHGPARADLPVAEEELNTMRLIMLLRKVPLFSEMTLEQLEVLSRIVTETDFYAGEVIFRESDAGDALYVVVAGKVKVVKNFGTSHEMVLVELGEMAQFGEMAVLSDEPRSATVVVSEDAKLISLKGERLKEIVTQKPEIAFQIIKVLSERLKDADCQREEMKKENVRLSALLAPGGGA